MFLSYMYSAVNITGNDARFWYNVLYSLRDAIVYGSIYKEKCIYWHNE